MPSPYLGQLCLSPSLAAGDKIESDEGKHIDVELMSMPVGDNVIRLFPLFILILLALIIE